LVQYEVKNGEIPIVHINIAIQEATKFNSKSNIQITFEDNGPGFADSNKLFHLFEKGLDSKGLGIGLWSSNRIISSIGGYIQIDRSVTLGGASVSIILPRA